MNQRWLSPSILPASRKPGPARCRLAKPSWLCGVHVIRGRLVRRQHAQPAFQNFPRSLLSSINIQHRPPRKSSLRLHTSKTAAFKMPLNTVGTRAPRGAGSFSHGLDVRPFPFKSDPTPANNPNSSPFESPVLSSKPTSHIVSGMPSAGWLPSSFTRHSSEAPFCCSFWHAAQGMTSVAYLFFSSFPLSSWRVTEPQSRSWPTPVPFA